MIQKRDLIQESWTSILIYWYGYGWDSNVDHWDPSEECPDEDEPHPFKFKNRDTLRKKNEKLSMGNT